MTAGYPSLPGTSGFAAAFGFGHSLFPTASVDRNLTTVGEGCVSVGSGHVGKCGRAGVGAVDEAAGGYAVASRC